MTSIMKRNFFEKESSENEPEDDVEDDSFSEFNSHRDLDNPKFTIGMLFGTKQEFKDAVREYSIRGGFDIKFTQSEDKKIQANCQGCTWKIYVSAMSNSTTL